MVFLGFLNTSITFLLDGKFHTLGSWKRNMGLSALPDHEDIREPCGERMSRGVLNVDDLVATRVSLTMFQNTNTSRVAASGDHDQLPHIEAENVRHFVRLKGHLHSVVRLDAWVGVTDSTAIVGHNVWHSLLTDSVSLDTAKLVLGFLRGHTVDDEASLGIVKKAEVFIGSIQSDNIHETSGEAHVGADTMIDLHKAVHADFLNITTRKSILEAITENQHQGQAFTLLVWSWRWADGPFTSHFTQHPVMRGSERLIMFSRSSYHFLTNDLCLE